VAAVALCVMRRRYMVWYLQSSDQGSMVSCIIRVTVNLRNLLYMQPITCGNILSYVIKSVAAKHVAACGLPIATAATRQSLHPLVDLAHKSLPCFFQTHGRSGTGDRCGRWVYAWGIAGRSGYIFYGYPFFQGEES
jgi:hypothetical protein